MPEILRISYSCFFENKKTYVKPKKRSKRTEREVSPALLLLRCKEIGLSMDELEDITEGMVLDMLAERGNDEWYRKHDTVYVADEEDFDRF